MPSMAQAQEQLVPLTYPGRYPFCMPDLTSLKVPPEVRDRFAAAAKARGLTVRALLDELSRQVVDVMLMEQAAEDMARLRDSDPVAWERYVDEGRAWEEGASERLDT